MNTTIRKASNQKGEPNIAVLISGKNKLPTSFLSKQELSFVKDQVEKKDKKFVAINQYSRWVFIQVIDQKKELHINVEGARKAGDLLTSRLNASKIESVTVVADDLPAEIILGLVEGMALGNYQFLKYKKDAKKSTNSLKTINIDSKKITQKQIDNLIIITEATYLARTLVNEPVSYLNAEKLSEEFQDMGKKAGFSVEVFNKAKIESLKMGGLLSVNKGSIDPPTFTIMEWKPKNAKNKKPYVFVGKGVVYDTGGLSLKPTGNSMDYMKCDMAGGAAVGGALYAIAKAKLPIHVIGLVPATDNRPGGNAFAPGDVVTMYNGITVEMLNSDAEGRMILGDALSYAKKYDPELVIDLATLTGAAAAAVGPHGIVCMGTAKEEVKNKLKESGNRVYERLAEFPFWDEYDDLIKSDLADIKNVGGPSGGAITAGKFLQRFADYPWMHFDIAGPAYVKASNSYRGQNGTGVGVRLLFDFINNL